jgi:hypothetical protein
MTFGRFANLLARNYAGSMDTASGAELAIADSVSDAHAGGTLQCVPTRGVAWVLRWAAALAVLYFSGCVLAEFACCLAAEHTLARAARAGALEATLPRATCGSVRAVTRRRLTGYQHASGQLQLVIRQNSVPLRAKLELKPGDWMSVSIATTARAVTPLWLQTLKFWGSDEQIVVTAERQIPGHKLRRGRES